MKAVILAAGKGTRMGALTSDIPKPMIQVAGKPVIEHIIRRILDSGIREFVVVTRYLGNKIEEYLRDGSKLGASIEYVEQSDKYGTGAALLEAREQVANEPVLMTFADIITPAFNYSGALKTFQDTGGAAVITLNWVDDPYAGGAVDVGEDGLVRRITEKPPKGRVLSHWNSSGIFVFDPVVFEYLARLAPSARGEYELPDAGSAMIDDGLAVHPYYLRGPWIDVGTPQDVTDAEKMLLEDGFDDPDR